MEPYLIVRTFKNLYALLNKKISLEDIFVKVSNHHNVSIEYVMNNTEGLWNYKKQSTLTISDKDFITYIETCYNVIFDYPSTNILYLKYFNFITKKIFYHTSENNNMHNYIANNKLKRIDTALLNVFDTCINEWLKFPHSDNYIIYARKFNYYANIINQQLKLDTKIPLAISSKQKIKLTDKASHNLIIESLSCTRVDESDFNKNSIEWHAHNLIINNHNNIPNLLTNKNYKKLCIFHNNSLTIHKSSNWRCSIRLNEITNILNIFISEVGVHKINKVEPIKCFGSKQSLLVKSKIGNLSLRCPCHYIDKQNNDIHRCNVMFDITNDDVIESLNHFNINESTKDLIEILKHNISNEIIKVRQSFRINTICPLCNKNNINEEALYNDTGNNPKLKHPSDMICTHCGYHYCTDCKKEFHNNIICRGFTDDENKEYGKMFQKSPCCGNAFERIDGCTYIKCDCEISWCWKCRCIRGKEGSVIPHYCIIKDQYIDNPLWKDNSDIVVYESLAPLNFINDDN